VKVNALCSFETLVTTHTPTQSHIQKDLHSQLPHCNRLTSHIFFLCLQLRSWNCGQETV